MRACCTIVHGESLEKAEHFLETDASSQALKILLLRIRAATGPLVRRRCSFQPQVGVVHALCWAHRAYLTHRARKSGSTTNRQTLKKELAPLLPPKKMLFQANTVGVSTKSANCARDTCFGAEK